MSVSSPFVSFQVTSFTFSNLNRDGLGGRFCASETFDFSDACGGSFCLSAIEGHSGVFVTTLARQRAFFEGLSQHQNTLAYSDCGDLAALCRCVGLVAPNPQLLRRLVYRLGFRIVSSVHIFGLMVVTAHLLVG